MSVNRLANRKTKRLGLVLLKQAPAIYCRGRANRFRDQRPKPPERLAQWIFSVTTRFMQASHFATEKGREVLTNNSKHKENSNLYLNNTTRKSQT